MKAGPPATPTLFSGREQSGGELLRLAYRGDDLAQGRALAVLAFGHTYRIERVTSAQADTADIVVDAANADGVREDGFHVLYWLQTGHQDLPTGACRLRVPRLTAATRRFLSRHPFVHRSANGLATALFVEGRADLQPHRLCAFRSRFTVPETLCVHLTRQPLEVPIGRVLADGLLVAA